MSTGSRKSIKSALLIFNDISFPKTHSINMLIALLKGCIQVSLEVESAMVLNDYAVETRYPGEYEPVTEIEYFEAVDIASKVIQWVKEELGN